MRLFTPEISWHQKEPVLSADFCPKTWRLASSGADFTVKIWQVKEDKEGNVGLDFLSNLDHHTKPVNVVRFSPSGKVLASAGDDYVIILWTLNANDSKEFEDKKADGEDTQDKESWSFTKVLRGHVEDVYDISWSPDGTKIVSGSVDNSAIIWDAMKGQKLQIINDHHHYVQGVTWDPRGQLIATHSSDRSCKIYDASTYRCKQTIHKTQAFSQEGEDPPKSCKLFLDETMQSFFRRCSFSPDGSLLVLPGGIFEAAGKVHKTTYVYARGFYNKPVLHLPSLKKASVAVEFCPVLFELVESKNQDSKPLFTFPYRMIFAVATLDSIVLYDTQHLHPFGYISNIHYASITDLTWSSDGRILVVSSMDGYCSFVTFEEGELGTISQKDPIKSITEEKDVSTVTPVQENKEKELEVIPQPSPAVSSPVCDSKVVTPVHNTIDRFITPVRKRKSSSLTSPHNDKKSPLEGSPQNQVTPQKTAQNQSPQEATDRSLTQRGSENTPERTSCSAKSPQPKALLKAGNIPQPTQQSPFQVVTPPASTKQSPKNAERSTHGDQIIDKDSSAVLTPTSNTRNLNMEPRRVSFVTLQLKDDSKHSPQPRRVPLITLDSDVSKCNPSEGIGTENKPFGGHSHTVVDLTDDNNDDEQQKASSNNDAINDMENCSKTSIATSDQRPTAASSSSKTEKTLEQNPNGTTSVSEQQATAPRRVSFITLSSDIK